MLHTERHLDVDWSPAGVFAVMSDPRRVREWSALFTPAREIDTSAEPFRVSYRGCTADGAQFDVVHRVTACNGGARVDVVVDVEPAGTTDIQRLRQAVEADVERTTAHLAALLDRYRSAPPSAAPEPPARVPEPTRARRVLPLSAGLLAATLVADMAYTVHRSGVTANVAFALSTLAALAISVTAASARRAVAVAYAPLVALAVVNAVRRVAHPAAAIRSGGLVCSMLAVVGIAAMWWFGEASHEPRDSTGVEAGVGEHDLVAAGPGGEP